HKVKNSILELVPARPELEFAEVRQMHRRFILHIGPTNSGKTFRSLERLKLARCGVYLGPLRLLALEVYEQMNKYEVPCTMRTGQECIEEADSRVVASTIEMADFDENYDIAVIDEAQMVTDPDRGHSWTKAILGIRAGEIHICMSPAAEQAIIHLIELCRDDYEIERYERKTALICEDEPFVFPDDVRKGDALIVFSKKSVLDVAGRLEEQKINASVIYGSLPPEIRRRQMHLFNSGRTKVVVATDAIGMGLNLPVRRIVFLQAEKYDGVSRRPLLVSEIKQIAGRAGRFGIYDSGYVNAMGREELQYIRERYEAEEDPVSQVHLGFPQILLDIEAPMDELLKIWHDVTPTEPFVKENIDEALYLYEQAKRCKEMIDGFENKHVLYRMITCPIDIKDRFVVSLWLQYCRTYTADVSLEKPVFHRDRSRGIMQYETYYKQLDLYYQFSHRMQKVIDEEWLESEREKTEMAIMRYLTKGKYKYIARCKYCGKLLQLGSPFQVCDHCYHRDGRREHFRQKERMEKG
ncbi:MAG: ATP-dependent helicase, partial [Lachnospiraceae bacterium]|nr:ATP-dependent helicase [Lachnospiraceae bacterium]